MFDDFFLTLSLFLEVLLDCLLDFSDLVFFFLFEAHNVAFGEGQNFAPVGQDAGDSADDTLHFTCVNELAVDAILKLLNNVV